MPQDLPLVFLDRLRKIIPVEHFEKVVGYFSRPLPITVRVNTLKIKRAAALEHLKTQGISFREFAPIPEALFLEGITSPQANEIDLVKDGRLYRQALSSMLPVLALDPQPGERVLDLCAAPGSKTTQIAARMNNQGELIAVEVIKPRFYKLKTVCQLLGVENITFKLTDGRRFRSHELFDKILVDAPCSSEGRFSTLDKDSFGYWSPRKIKEMVQKQRGLLLTASRLLKPGGTLIYSTCTFAPEENEGVVSWVLKKAPELKVEPLPLGNIPSYPAILEWEEKAFNPAVKDALRVLPTENTEGFFIIKLTK